jgi:hypothetical protein
MTSMPDTSENGIDLGEAARQLELAVHDAQVAYDCIGLDHLDRAHTYAITARAAVDAAETILRTVLGAAADGDGSQAGTD